jgi:arylsulfatase A-like enzyme
MGLFGRLYLGDEHLWTSNLRLEESRHMRFGIKLAFLIGLAAVLSCGTQSGPSNVIIIGIDTLRPDHLGCYGYGRNTSPNIDRLAVSGAVFENAISQAPWTLPSFATVFTSLYPSQHGATTMDTRLRTSVPTLASILRDRGFAVAAIVNAPVFRPEFGLNRGFEHYDAMPPGTVRRADEITNDALEWIDARDRDPFYLFVHYFDPHLSYSPPAPYDTLFNPDYHGPIGSSFDLDYFSSLDISTMRTEIGALPPADIGHIIALYDGEIAFTDNAIGALLDGLERRGLRENTLIVLLSDHGEEFLDHGGLDHGHSLYNELIRVPLIFSLPGTVRRNTRITPYCRLLDVTPTILDMLEIVTGDSFEGVSNRALLTGRPAAPVREARLLPPNACYSEAMRRSNATKSVLVDAWKLVYNTETSERMVFDLQRDPGEKHNLAAQKPQEIRAADDMLFRAMVGMSDTWYVRMAGGREPHIFNLTISPQRDAGIGEIQALGFLDQDGHYAGIKTIPDLEVTGSYLTIRGLSLANELTLLFKTTRKLLPLAFDLTIDGLPATERTYLGQALEHPRGMPFLRNAGRQSVRADSPPVRIPHTPSFLIWHTEAPYGGDRTVHLEEATKSELRALGYIQ